MKNNIIKKDPRKIETILNIPSPKNADELRQFLGMIIYMLDYPRVINDHISSSMSLTLKLPMEMDCCKNAFIHLRTEIASDCVLIPYDPELSLLLVCDASLTGIAGVLSHIIEGVESQFHLVPDHL